MIPLGLPERKFIQFPVDLHIKTLHSSCKLSSAIPKSENESLFIGVAILIDKFQILIFLQYFLTATCMLRINSSSSILSFLVSGNTFASNKSHPSIPTQFS